MNEFVFAPLYITLLFYEVDFRLIYTSISRMTTRYVKLSSPLPAMNCNAM